MIPSSAAFKAQSKTPSPETDRNDWVFSGNRSAVRDVMVGGRWTVVDGRHVSGERITSSFRETIRGLV